MSVQCRKENVSLCASCVASSSLYQKPVERATMCGTVGLQLLT